MGFSSGNIDWNSKLSMGFSPRSSILPPPRTRIALNGLAQCDSDQLPRYGGKLQPKTSFFVVSVPFTVAHNSIPNLSLQPAAPRTRPAIGTSRRPATNKRTSARKQLPPPTSRFSVQAQSSILLHTWTTYAQLRSPPLLQ